MSQPAAPDSVAVTITPLHYQTLCGLALGTIVLIRMQHFGLDRPSQLFVHALILSLGAFGILDRVRFSPMLMLLAIAVPYLIERQDSDPFFDPDLRSMRFLDGADVLVCMAALTYFIGHYRLLGLWAGVLPADSRSPAAARAKPAPPQRRSEESLNAAEVAALVFTVPAFALLAEFACLLLKQPWMMTGIDPRWNQFLLIAWTMLLAMFLTAHAFRYWRRLQMDRATALLMLQDILWHETRGEQRRIHRWLAWKKLRAKK